VNNMIKSIMFLLAVNVVLFVGIRFFRALWGRYSGDDVNWEMWGVSIFVALAGINYIVQQFFSYLLTSTSTNLLPTLFGVWAYAFGTHTFYKHFLPFFRKPKRNWAFALAGILSFIILLVVVVSFVFGDENIVVWYLREGLVSFLLSCFLLLTTVKFILPGLAWVYLVEEGSVVRSRLLILTLVHWIVVIWRSGELIGVAGWVVGVWPFGAYDELRHVVVSTVGSLWLIGYFAPSKWLGWLGRGSLYLSSFITFVLLWVVERRVRYFLEIYPRFRLVSLRDLLLQPDYIVYEMVIYILDHRKLLTAQAFRSPGWLLGRRISLTERSDIRYEQVISVLRTIGADIIRERFLFPTLLDLSTRTQQ
jgi:hypothetical protein